MVFTTRQGLQAIHELGLRWRSESQHRKRRLSPARTRILAVEVFGEALEAGMLYNKHDLGKARKDLERRLDARLDAAAHQLFHYFPCYIFDDTSVGAFNVGPVRILPRLEWLDHVEKTAGKETNWADCVRTVWADGEAPPTGETPPELGARTVIDGFGTCAWAATVSVQGNDIGRSQERGHAAVRLAVDAMGLVLSRQRALNLRGPGDKLCATLTRKLMQRPGTDIYGEQILDLPTLGGAPSFSTKYLTDTTSYREAAGRAIEAIIDPSSTATLLALRHRWCDALFWFGEARRDTTDFMALVRYGMTLDILAKGKKASGIAALLAALLGCKADALLLMDGTTLKQAVKKIYEDGRSQLGHGGRPALLEDLPFSREGADLVASIALKGYVLCLSLYTGADSYEDFLRAIPGLVQRLPK